MEIKHMPSWKERVGILATGYAAKQVEEKLFDYMLYPSVIATAGTVWGGLIMTALSALVCFFYLKFYDWSKQDWLGLELLKEVREGEHAEGFWGTLVRKILSNGDVPAFFLFSLWQDPFVTTVYLRKGADKYNGMSERDWKVFFCSVIVANLWWTGIVSSIVHLFQWIFH